MCRSARISCVLDIDHIRVGPRLDRESFRPELIESLCGLLVDAFPEVPVCIQRRLDGRVAEPRLDQLRVHALGDQHGGVAVAEIVESARLADGRSYGG